MDTLYISRLLAEHGCSPIPGDSEGIRKILLALGIDPASELGWFYMNYAPMLVRSGEPREELLNVMPPDASSFPSWPSKPWETPVGSTTVYVREGWAVPDEFICLSTIDTEGTFLYHLPTGSIYDFNLGQDNELRSGALQPRWKTFFEFIEWYLS